MNKIVVYRTHIEIVDYDLGDCKAIEYKHKIYDKIYHRFYIKAMIYDEKKRILILPRGTNISDLEYRFNSKAHIDYSIDPIRKFKIPLKLKYKPRDNVQREAIEFMLGKNVYEYTNSLTSLSVNLNTGKGKSYCAIASIVIMNQACAIITDTTGCLNQWIDYFMEYTNIDPDDIYLISGYSSIKKLYKKDINHIRVFLFSHSSLQHFGTKHGWESVHDLFKYLGIGIKIFDEAHTNFDNMMYIDSYTNSYKTYYITATLGRSDDRENKIFSDYFNNTPKIDLFDENNDPHTDYIAIKYNSNPSTYNVSDCMGQYGLNRNLYSNYVVHQENFKRILHILISHVKTFKGKSLWYIGTNESIIVVRNWIYSNYPEFINNVGIYTSIIPKAERELALNKKIILSTTKSAGKAIDIKSLKETINLAEPFKSKILAQQTLGRTRNENTLYVDIVDVGFKSTSNYYRIKKPVFHKYAKSCREIILRNNELEYKTNKIIDSRKSLIFPIIYEGE